MHKADSARGHRQTVAASPPARGFPTAASEPRSPRDEIAVPMPELPEDWLIQAQVAGARWRFASGVADHAGDRRRRIARDQVGSSRR